MHLKPLVLSALAALLCSCAATSVKKTWKSPAYQGGPVTKLAVLTIDDRGSLRKGFENRFVASLNKPGTTAITTFDLLSLNEINQDKPAAAARLRSAGAEVVLTLRLVDAASSYREVQPGGERYAAVTTGIESYGWYDYYSLAFANMSPTYGSLKMNIFLETTLFDLKTGARLWSGVTETVITERMDRVSEMDPIVAKAVAAMRKDGMVP
jgi:hypothetical protein